MPPPVPVAYLLIHTGLSDSPDEFQSYLDANWDGVPGDTVYGAELLVTSGNRGEAQLTPKGMPAVRLCLDRLQEISAGGATLQIADPRLNSVFRRSDQYLAF